VSSVSSSSATAEAGSKAQARVPWASFTGVYLLLFLIGTETFLISPLLPTIAGYLKVSADAAASTVTAYTIVYAVTAPFLGTISDRFGRRPTILAGAVLFLLGNALAAVSGSLTLLIVARVVGALGAGFAGPSIWAHLAERSPEAVRGRAVGLGMALFSAGQVLGVPIGSFLAGWGGWHDSFWALAAVTVISLPLLERQVRVQPQARAGSPTAAGDSGSLTTGPGSPTAGLGSSAGLGSPAKPAGRQPLRLGSVFGIWSDPMLRQTLIVVLLLQAANLGAYTYLGDVLHDRFGLSVRVLGLVGILVGAGSVLGSLAAGRIGDRMRASGANDAVWVPVWAVVLGGAVVAASLVSPLAVACVAVFVWFFASGAFVTDTQTLLINARPTLAATSSSWSTASLYGGAAIGTTAVGGFRQTDIGTAVIGGGLGLLSAFVALPLILRLRQPRLSQPKGAHQS
jgi:DHA1 family inner membrane transport protein